MAEYIDREEAIAWFMPYVHAGESIEADVVKMKWRQSNMEDIQTLLEMEMSVAEVECRRKYGCRNGSDCFKCELLKRSCVKSYIAEQLLKKFNISEKEEMEAKEK